MIYHGRIHKKNTNKNSQKLEVDPHTVDGRHPAPVEVGSLFHYLQGFDTSKVVFSPRQISEASFQYFCEHFVPYWDVLLVLSNWVISPLYK